MNRTRYYVLALPKLPKLIVDSQLLHCVRVNKKWYMTIDIARHILVKDFTEEDKTFVSLLGVQLFEVHLHDVSISALEKLNEWDLATNITCSTIQLLIS